VSADTYRRHRDCLLYVRGASWHVIGPADKVRAGVTIDAWLPQANTTRQVTIQSTRTIENRRAIGYPDTPRCTAQIRGERCTLPRAHKGWCK
jgi:hypothetical protein